MIERAVRTLKDSLISAVAGGVVGIAGKQLLQWLGMSSQGALVGALVAFVPTFVAVQSYLYSRSLRKEVDTLKDTFAGKQPPGNASESGTVTVYAAQVPGGKIPIRGLAVVRTVSIEYMERETAFGIQCVADFVGLREGQRASPLELELTGRNGSPELATLKTKSAATNAGATMYEGRANASVMNRYVADCMSTRRRAMANMTFPPEPGLYWCDVEVHKPAGHALAEHEKSGIKLDFELTGGGCHRFMVRIN